MTKILSNFTVFPDKALAVLQSSVVVNSEFFEENEKCREIKARKKFVEDCN